MERLNPLSAAFLTAEDVDPAVSLAIGSFAILDGPTPTIGRLRDRLAERLDLAPRYTQKIHRRPWDLAAPTWVVDSAFDLENHVRHLALPHPGGAEQVAELVAWLMGTRMDRGQPLWEIWLCEGLAQGRWGLLCRVHHALADGLSATALLRILYDSEGDGAKPRHIRVAEGASGWAEVAARAVRGGVTMSSALPPAHPTTLIGPLGRARGYAWVEVSIEASRALRRRHGVSLNDVALASITAGFRQLLLARGERPDARALRSLVPVSAWPSADVAHPDNRVSLVLAMLPVDEPDPLRRLQTIHDRVDRLRRRDEPVFGSALQTVAGWAPYPLVHAATTWGLRFPQHQVTTVTTSVPGPRDPLHCLGGRVVQMLPYVPIAGRVRIGVAMFSYCDALTFGVTTDLDSTSDTTLLADAIGAAWEELLLL